MLRTSHLVGTIIFQLAALLFLNTHPVCAQGFSKSHYVIPPQVVSRGLMFGSEKIPLNKAEPAQRIVEQINFYLMDRRSGLLEMFDRMDTYGPLVSGVISEEQMPADIIYLAAALSDMNPTAKTKTGGVGLWSLNAARDKREASNGIVINSEWDDRRDPVISTRIAANTLRSIRKKAEAWDLLLTMCAFVDGAEKIEAASSKAKGFGYWDLVLPHFSEVLIPKILALKIIHTNKEFYGIDTLRKPAVAFDQIDKLTLTKDLPLHVVADWISIPPKLLWELNPGVDPGFGKLSSNDKKSPSANFLRIPKSSENKVKQMLVKDGYVSR